MFFLGEYTNMLLMATIIVLLFFGGWLPLISILAFMPGFWLSFKVIIFCFLYILVRAALPRYRYDQLMDIGWKLFLPLSLGYLLFIIGVLFSFDALPQVFEIIPCEYKENHILS
jgi:NADH-quinone oxidoreductase subunit H